MVKVNEANLPYSLQFTNRLILILWNIQEKKILLLGIIQFDVVILM